MFRKLIVGVILVVVLTPGVALAVQYPPSTSTTRPDGPTTTRPDGTTTTTDGAVVKPPDDQRRPDGQLPRTGAETITLLVRIGALLLVSGFVLYLAARNRRVAAASGHDSGPGTA